MLFDDYEKNLTLDKCRSQFTEDELQKLQEFGQHIVVRQNYLKFGDDQSEELVDKFINLFQRWIDSQVRHKEDINGLVVEMDVLPQELEARKNFPDFFMIYSAEEGIEKNISIEEMFALPKKFDIPGLFLTFIQGLGIDIKFEQATENTGNLSRMIYDENTPLLQITHRKYSGALSTKKNSYAYLVPLDQLPLVQGADGSYRLDPDSETEEQKKSRKKTIPAKNVDSDLIAALAAAVKSSYVDNKGDEVTVDLTSFAKALKTQFEKESADNKSHFDFWGKVKQLYNIGGYLVKQGEILPVFLFRKYDVNRNELTFASPYLYSILDILKKEPANVSKQKRYNRKLYPDILGESYLIDAKIITARSKVTSEVVKYIIMRLMQHGIVPDAKRYPQNHFESDKVVTLTISYKELVKDVQLLKEYLSESEPKRRSRNIRNVIFGSTYDDLKKDSKPLVETYLRDYTDAFSYWVNLSIKTEPVSMKELDNKITLTHYGKNGNFEPRLHIPHAADQDNIFDDV